MISVNQVVDVAKSFGINGELGGSRTHNLQIKSPNCPSFACAHAYAFGVALLADRAAVRH